MRSFVMLSVPLLALCVGPLIARISHRPSAAALHLALPAALRSFGLLDVSQRIRLRGPQSQALQAQHLHRFATIAGEKCGLGAVYDIELKNPEDSVWIRSSTGRDTFLFTSRSGIGEATIMLKKGQWPDTLLVQLCYNESRGFSRLESFTVDNGSIRATNALGRPDTVVCVTAANGPSLPRGKAFMPIVKRDDIMEMQIPTVAMSADVRALHISWIDAYRD